MSEAVLSGVGSVERGRDVRLAARAGFSGLTVGRAAGFVQANVYLVPDDVAADFEAFCLANPAACPLLGRSEPGSTALPTLGRDIDLRTDLPAYLIHAAGHKQRVTSLADVWRDDLVAFAIGCWFGAEGALAAAGIPMRHRDLGRQGGLYRTSIAAISCGRFAAPVVVSMRPFQSRDQARVTAITGQLPLSHGAPIHCGDPAALGIADLATADWGDPVLPVDGEIALYWPCGLTALAALEATRLPLFISHAPGAMLVTDLQEFCPA